MSPRYHVFLSHSSADKPAVEEIARRLREEGIEPFLDKWHLVPGEPWQEALEDALDESATCAVFLSTGELGPWQNEEMRTALDERVKNGAFRVIPVLLPGAQRPGKKDLPRFLSRLTWVDFKEGIDDGEALRLLLCGIRGEAPGPGDVKSFRPRSMAPTPQVFIHRQEYDLVVEALCANNTYGSTVGITTALRGAGGFGKTALAQAVCQNERVWNKYQGGILWTTMGEEVSESGRLSRLRDLIRWWTENEPPVFETIDSASAFLRSLLGKFKVLLVVDDAWSDLDLIPFQGMCSALLITTREKDILPSGSERIDVDAMKVPEAVNLLRADLPEWKISAFKDLAQRLGEWPLLLTLVNRQLREMVEEDGFTIEEALKNVESTLQAEGLTAFDRENLQSRQSAVAKTLAVSLRRLQDSELSRYHDLSVFPEDVEIPVSVLERFWGMSQSETAKFCRRLDSLSLLLRFERRTGILQIHDVVRHYLVHQKGYNLPNIHRRFLGSLHPQSGFWKDLAEKEAYIWRYLGYHLLEVGEKSLFRDLLLDLSFLQAKLRSTDINALLADYEPFVKEDEELLLIQRALWMSAHIIAENPEQLAPHLLGRLLGGETAGLKHLLEQCRNTSRLRPRAPSFRPPGSLLRTIEVGSSVNALALVDNQHAVSGSADGMLRLWDLEIGQILRTLQGHSDSVNVVAVVDERRAVSGSDDGTLRLWDMDTGQILRIEKHDASVNAVAIVDSRRAISGSADGTLRVRDLEIEQSLRILEEQKASVNAVAVVDGRHFVSGSADGTLRVWDLETEQSLRILKGHTASINAIAIVDGWRAISCSDDKTLRLWDLETGKTLRVLQGHNAWVWDVAVVDGRRAVSTSADETLLVWDLETGQILQTLQGHDASVKTVAIVDGQRAVSGSLDRTLRTWDLRSGKTLRTLQGHNASVKAVAVIDGRRAISGSEDRTLRIWNLETGQILHTLQGHSTWVWAVAVVDNRCAISGSADGMLLIWDLRTGETLQTLRGPTKASVKAVAMMADSRRVISGSGDGTLRIWDLKTGEILRTFQGHKDRVTSIVVVGSRYAISGSEDRTLRVWDLETGQTLRILRGHNGWVRAVAVVDSRRVVSASSDGTLRVWDLEIRQSLLTLEGHNSSVTAIAVVDGRRAVSGSDDRTLRVWELETGKCLAVLVLEAAVTSIAVAPDERTVVAGDESGRVHFLELDVDALN